MSISGNIVTDNWILNTTYSINSPFLYITNQTGFDWQNCDGIFGLSVASYNQYNSPVWAMQNKGIIERAVVGIYLSNQINSTDSQIYIGGIDKAKTKNKIAHYLDITSDTYWQVELGGASYGSNIINISSTDCKFDIGIPQILIPNRMRFN